MNGWYPQDADLDEETRSDYNDLDANEIMTLSKLTAIDKKSFMWITTCNAASGGNSIALAFHNSQNKMAVYGNKHFSSFSTQYNEYTPIKPNTEKMYLRSFFKGKNTNKYFGWIPSEDKQDWTWGPDLIEEKLYDWE